MSPLNYHPSFAIKAALQWVLADSKHAQQKTTQTAEDRQWQGPAAWGHVPAGRSSSTAHS